MKKNRIYNLSDVVMILASGVIAKNFCDLISELTKVHTNWDKTYATAVSTKVDMVATELLGENTKARLFDATNKLNELIVPAAKDISSMKKHIDVDFKTDPVKRNTLLKELGFTDNFEKVHNHNHAAVVALLLIFSRNITDYKADIIAKGTPSDLLERLAGYAKVVKDANTLQDQLKITTKDVTKEMVDQLNEVYSEIIGICKLASDHFLGDRVKKEMFTFEAVTRKVVQLREAAEDDKKNPPAQK